MKTCAPRQQMIFSRSCTCWPAFTQSDGVLCDNFSHIPRVGVHAMLRSVFHFSRRRCRRFPLTSTESRFLYTFGDDMGVVVVVVIGSRCGCCCCCRCHGRCGCPCCCGCWLGRCCSSLEAGLTPAGRSESGPLDPNQHEPTRVTSSLERSTCSAKSRARRADTRQNPLHARNKRLETLLLLLSSHHESNRSGLFSVHI